MGSPDDTVHRILVSHPHAASVANHVAAAFERKGWLAQYTTGVAAAIGSVRAGLLQGMARYRKATLNRLVESVPANRLCSLWGVEIAARAAGRLAEAGNGHWWRSYDAIFVAHDAVVARLPWPPGLDAVYAYEDGALNSFRRARRHDVSTIWDLPLPHWRTLESIWVQESVRWPGAMGPRPHVEPEWKKKRKDSEMGLADVVAVASRFTWQSLEAAECQKPVVEVPYGFPVESFVPKRRGSEGPFTVLSVGTQDLRKGTPYLLEAWRRAGISGGRLRLIGSMRLTDSFLSRYRGQFTHLSYLPRSDLAREYREADLLALPTLGDGFGLVIQEAMCCATPVVTTPCGGGPECITDGVNGWLVPARDVDALVERLRQAASDREKIFQMGQAARTRAERYPWRKAEERITAVLGAAFPIRRHGA